MAGILAVTASPGLEGQTLHPSLAPSQYYDLVEILFMWTGQTVEQNTLYTQHTGYQGTSLLI